MQSATNCSIDQTEVISIKLDCASLYGGRRPIRGWLVGIMRSGSGQSSLCPPLVLSAGLGQENESSDSPKWSSNQMAIQPNAHICRIGFLFLSNGSSIALGLPSKTSIQQLDIDQQQLGITSPFGLCNCGGRKQILVGFAALATWGQPRGTQINKPTQGGWGTTRNGN